MAADKKLFGRILDLIPQRPPFRFIDDILDINEKTITASYRFRSDEGFYKGHFSDCPVTPGVILIETMAQTGVVAMGIFQLMLQDKSEEEIKQMTSLFAFADEIEFSGIVYPGEKVIIQGEKIYMRKNTIKTKGRICREGGETVCSGVLTGTGVNTGTVLLRRGSMS
jgi:3-hydroxyacyl-[acyl-carrier-protein] dehydratase